MINYPCFTIVTPSLNQGQFIGDTIRSIWSQAGDLTINHIIADGGSTDNTVEVIKQYEQKLNSGKFPINCRGLKFTWWCRKDKGQADAVNQGLKLGKGEFMAWLNSDDFYLPGALSFVASYFSTHPSIDCMYGDLNLVDKFGRNPLICDYVSDYSFFRLLKYCYIPQPATFFRQSSYKRTGQLDTRYQYAFDYDYWLRFHEKGVKLGYGGKHVLASLRTYPSRKTEFGFIAMRREVMSLMLRHGYYIAPALYESIYHLSKHFLTHSRNP